MPTPALFISSPSPLPLCLNRSRRTTLRKSVSWPAPGAWPSSLPFPASAWAPSSAPTSACRVGGRVGAGVVGGWVRRGCKGGWVGGRVLRIMAALFLRSTGASMACPAPAPATPRVQQNHACLPCRSRGPDQHLRHGRPSPGHAAACRDGARPVGRPHARPRRAAARLGLPPRPAAVAAAPVLVHIHLRLLRAVFAPIISAHVSPSARTEHSLPNSVTFLPKPPP